MKYNYSPFIFFLFFVIDTKAQFVEIRDTTTCFSCSNNKETDGNEIMEFVYYVHKDDYDVYLDSIENGKHMYNDPYEILSKYKVELNFLTICNGEMVSNYDRYGILVNTDTYRFNHMKATYKLDKEQLYSDSIFQTFSVINYCNEVDYEIGRVEITTENYNEIRYKDISLEHSERSNPKFDIAIRTADYVNVRFFVGVKGNNSVSDNSIGKLRFYVK